MGEIKQFQVCYEGELTAEVAAAMRRLGGVPNFHQSWLVWMDEERQAAPLVRWLRKFISPDARVLVAETRFSIAREYLLVRHSMTPGREYEGLFGALENLGILYELPFESTFVVRSAVKTDMRWLGNSLSEHCGDDALMVMGVTADWAYCNSSTSRIRRHAVTRSELGRSSLLSGATSRRPSVS